MALSIKFILLGILCLFMSQWEAFSELGLFGVIFLLGGVCSVLYLRFARKAHDA